MKTIHIFDIDGTILPSTFPNLQKNNKSIDEIIEDVLKRSQDVTLYPEFIRYYSHNCTNNTENFFLTGRQEKPFGSLTHSQLSPLKDLSPFHVIFYPGVNSYSLKQYYSWKIQEIQKLILEYNTNDPEGKININIYDDMNEYFNAIEEISKYFKICPSFRYIRNSKDWIL